ncbi:MAG: hypothetical protein ACP5UB_07140 [Candidatus Sumerlaeaceae bacterium]
MGVPQIYWFMESQWLLVLSEGEYSIFSVLMRRTPEPDKLESITHRWNLTILGTNGQAEVALFDRWTPMERMREFLVPANVPHKFCNRYEFPAQFTVIARPGGFEEFVKIHGIAMPPEAYVQVSIDPEIHRIEDWWIPPRQYDAPSATPLTNAPPQNDAQDKPPSNF